MIVLSLKAEQQLQKNDWRDEIELDLLSLSKVRLYKLSRKKKGQKAVIALPFPKGKAKGKTLLLKKNDCEDGKNYFICLEYLKFPAPSVPPSHYYELPGNVRPKIIRIEEIGQYPCAKDCDEIDCEVKERKPWKPGEGGGPEAEKWRAYLKLYKKMIDEQCFSLPAECIKITDKRAKFVPIFMDIDDAEIKGKINEAHGESVSFCLTADSTEEPNKKHKKKLGTISSFGDEIEIDLDENFFKSFRSQVKAKEFHARALVSKVNRGSIEFCKTKRQQQVDFYWGMSCEHKAFSCLAVRNKFVWKIDPDSINLHDLNLGVASSDSLYSKIKEKEFYVRTFVTDGIGSSDNLSKDESVTSIRLESVEFSKVEGQQIDCYYKESCDIKAFSCIAAWEKSGWKIDPDSIKPYRLMLFADFIGDLFQINIMKDGLADIRKHPIWKVLSGERVAKLPEEVRDVKWSEDCFLDDRQKSAVEMAMGAKELCLIWGPPGTGKTEVIAEIARQEAIRGNKILIASQANLAVDNALARLHGMPDVWTFRVAKCKYKLENEDEKRVPMKETIGDFFSKWLQGILDTAIKLPLVNDETTELRKQFYRRLQKNSAQAPERQMLQMGELYCNRINVVGATLMETGKREAWRDAKTGKRQNKLCKTLGVKQFDTVIVDEVSKAMPPELFLPILLGKRVVLVGDHKQLPPMVKLISSGDHLSLEYWADESDVPKDELDLETTIFERLWKKHGGEASPVREMLIKQYRMHPDIQSLIQQFYKDDSGELECGISKKKLLEMSVFPHPAVWVDTKDDADEKSEGTSFINHEEFLIVGRVLDALPRGLSVGIITFYGAQLRKLRKYENEYADKFSGGRLIFGTVDRFQGRECDVVICSLVRKNLSGDIGFARKLNRINVAFSRARKMLCIVGNKRQFCDKARRIKKQKEASITYKHVYDNCKKIPACRIEEVMA